MTKLFAEKSEGHPDFPLHEIIRRFYRYIKVDILPEIESKLSMLVQELHDQGLKKRDRQKVGHFTCKNF